MMGLRFPMQEVQKVQEGFPCSYCVPYWCAEWGCTEAELVAFVARFGDSVDSISWHMEALGRLRRSQNEPL